MAINPATTTTVKVSELASAGFNTTDLVPHEVGGYLKKGTLQDLATFIGAIISTDDSVGFRAVTVTDGQTLPATTEQEFILVGPGTYPNVGGGSPVTTTEPLNALVSNGTYWFIGVEIPISASGTWGSIVGTLDDQTDLKDALDLKADLVDGKVPASQLPSYVDDVVEVANYAALPATGETGKIYITLDTNKVYRWSGSAYIEIAANNAVWGSITGTLSSQTDLNSALGLKVPYTGATGNVDLGSHTLSSHDLVVNHTSGSGTAATISKGGNGEALTVTKSSGSGNVASFAGGVTSISELHLTTDLADAYIASAATWNAKQAALSGTGFVKASGSTISYDNSTYVPTSRTITINGFGYDLSSNVDFTIAPGVWGSITGTLSNQTDLQQTLNTKEGTISGGTTSQYWRGDKSWQNLNKTAVGLANVDNTTDLGKPISTATQTALDLKVPTSRSITINGVGYNLTADVNFNIGAGVWGQITGTLSNQTDLYQTLNTKMPADRAITINGVTQSLTQDRTWTISTIGGTGTNGYVAFWNGTSNQAGDSNFFWDNTNKRLGIGTASPYRPLQVKTADGTTALVLSPTSTSSSSIVRLDAANETGGSFSTFQLRSFETSFFTNGSERMRITSGGSVGIGTSSPASYGNYRYLQISGSSTTQGGVLYLTTSDNSRTGEFFVDSNGATLSSGSSTLNFYAGSSERMRIASGGQVQISSPITDALKLTNSNSGAYNGVQLENNAGNKVAIGIGGSTVGGSHQNTGYSGTITNIDYYLFTNNTERMRITSGGRVGIGTTSPSDILHLYKASEPQLYLQSSGATFRMGLDSDNQYFIYSSNAKDIYFGNNGTERMRIAANGAITATGTITASAGFFNSDMRLKDLTEYDYNVSDIKAISYVWKDGRDNQKHVGYSAQEVQKVMPDAVNEGKDGMLSVNYVEVLVAKIAQMEKEIELLKSK